MVVYKDLVFPLTDKVKKDALRFAKSLSNLLVDAVNGGIEEAFQNEKRIEMEGTAVQETD